MCRGQTACLVEVGDMILNPKSQLGHEFLWLWRPRWETYQRYDHGTHGEGGLI